MLNDKAITKLIIIFSLAVVFFLLGREQLFCQYLAPPTANFFVEESVPIDILQRIADAHAYNIWGEEIARGNSFPVVDETGDVFAYLFPYIVGSTQFPEHARIFDMIRTLR